MASMRDRSSLVKEYLENVAGRNGASADTYEQRLRRFDEYVAKEGIDATVEKLVSKKLDPYAVLSGFNAHLSKRGIAPRSQAQTVKTIKTFLDYSGVEISSARFKLKVMLPKIVKKQKQPLSKQDVAELIKMCRGNN